MGKRLQVELDEQLIARIQMFADEEGKPVDQLVDAALRHYVTHAVGEAELSEVRQHLDASIRRNGEVYLRLAKLG